MGLTKIVWCDGCGAELEHFKRSGPAIDADEVPFTGQLTLNDARTSHNYDLCDPCVKIALEHLQKTYGAVRGVVGSQ